MLRVLPPKPAPQRHSQSTPTEQFSSATFKASKLQPMDWPPSARPRMIQT